MSLRVALVIGIGSYEDNPLERCPPSANAVYDLLTSDEYGQCDVTRSSLIKDDELPITKARLDKVIEKTLKKIETDETFIFYYTGHASSLGNELFLETTDATETADGYRISNLVMGIRDRNITRPILIIDACQSAVALGALTQLHGKLDRKIAVLVSSGRYDFSSQKGLGGLTVFSTYFCEGIRRGCKGNVRPTDKTIDITAIKDYINKRIAQDYLSTDNKQEASSIISEGKEKLWVSKIPTSIPLKPTGVWESNVKNELTTLHDLYHKGYIIPEKCEKTVDTLKAIQNFLKDYPGGNKPILNVLIQQLAVLMNKVRVFKNYCLDTTEHSVEMRTNIVEILAEILGDLDYL